MVMAPIFLSWIERSGRVNPHEIKVSKQLQIMAISMLTLITDDDVRAIEVSDFAPVAWKNRRYNDDNVQ